MLQLLRADGLTPALTEVRSCGWLAQVDEYGGSIFHFRPASKGAADVAALVDEVRSLLAEPVVFRPVTTPSPLPASEKLTPPSPVEADSFAA